MILLFQISGENRFKMILRSILFAALIAMVSDFLFQNKKIDLSIPSHVDELCLLIVILPTLYLFLMINQIIGSIILSELDEYLKVLIGWVKGIGQSNSGGESWLEFSLHSTRLTSLPEAGESLVPAAAVQPPTKNTRAISWGQILLIWFHYARSASINNVRITGFCFAWSHPWFIGQVYIYIVFAGFTYNILFISWELQILFVVFCYDFKARFQFLYFLKLPALVLAFIF